MTPIYGGAGNDELRGEDGNNYLSGDEGNDVLIGAAGNDEGLGGAGDDRLFGDAGQDHLSGGPGRDQIDGGAGGDTLSGNEGIDRILGGDGSDLIMAGPGNDIVLAGVGNDTVYGDEGNDRLFGENSRDVIFGGAGDDLLEGGLASDDLFGGAGDDRLFSNVSDTTQPDETDTTHVLYGGEGSDVIHAEMGDDLIYGDLPAPGFVGPFSAGDDLIYGYAGADQIFADGGDDVIYADAGNDFVSGGAGADEIDGGSGDNVLFGDLPVGEPSDFDLTDPTKFENPPLIDPSSTTHRIVPVFLAGLSVAGNPGDGGDLLLSYGGRDFIFGGDGVDVISAGAGQDYVDAGAGHDLSVSAGDGDDVVRGGDNDDTVHGNAGIDLVYGDGGSDRLFGDAGDVNGVQAGQTLFGGPGIDYLYAFAPSPSPDGMEGDTLLGGADGDFLFGNVRNDTILGDSGKDFLHGDYLAGALYNRNVNAATTGGTDVLFGGTGDDQIFGGGEDDQLWGGTGTDILEGQQGSDTQYGGSGIDLFIAPTMVGHNVAGDEDVIDGHFDDGVGFMSPDDNATDILVINGTGNADTIVLSQTTSVHPAGGGKLYVDHPSEAAGNAPLTIDWKDAAGGPVLEQFQIAGLSGDDKIGFGSATASSVDSAFDLSGFSNREPLDLSALIARSNDFVGVFDGNGGHDMLLGALGRDRLDGGLGSDTAYGFAGDDRLWGDSGDGASFDHDVLYAGQGNDDLVGGQGTNTLHAWSVDPSTGSFGVYTDGAGLFDTDGGGLYALEDTGLNRMLGSASPDLLFGGTGVDFLYGNGGNDQLFRADGSEFSSLDDGLAGDAWKAYAKETDAVWYVGATNAADRINVDFVTEPGLLADHHLVTRLTENGGVFSFAAQVRLDFDAVDGEGNPIWDAEDIVFDANERMRAIELLGGDTLDETARGAALANVVSATTNLTDGLLPPEGEFLAIIIDGLDGNDEITVGPTVQKTVWVDAGAGDDVVVIEDGNAILIDASETGAPSGGLRGRNDVPSQAYPFDVPSTGLRIDNLTIDNPNDSDWYSFAMPTFSLPPNQQQLHLASVSPADDFTINLYNAADLSTVVASSSRFAVAHHRPELVDPWRRVLG